MRALLLAFSIIAVVALGVTGVASQEKQGRYVMSPTENGFVRLDTETGAMSVCAQRNGRWICELMEDEAQKLQNEITRLRAEVKRLEEQAAAGGAPSDAPTTVEPRKRLELPTEEEVDRALDYFESIFRKFRERIERFEEQERKERPEQKDGSQL